MTLQDINPTATMIDQHFNTKFGRILDIGAAFGEVSRSLQRLHGSEIWILEGDSANNAKKKPTASARANGMTAPNPILIITAWITCAGLIKG
jgi:2-polyprenyl-3-methyl-5-hydroxy-6-metoxy-1,4-benzoquinol methylase